MLDLWGALLVTSGLGGIIFGLIESSGRGFGHPLVLGALVFGFFVLIAFIILEGYTVAPMMPLKLFHSRNFSGANAVTFLLYAAFGGSLFFIPFNLIQVRGYSAASAGAAFLPSILIISLFSHWASGMVGRYGAKIPLVIGPTIVALEYLLFAIPGIGGSYWSTFFPGVVVLGFGMAISIAPLTTTGMNAVEERHSGLASGINNSTSRIAGLISIAVLGIIILYAFNTSLDNHLATLQISPETRQIISEQSIKLAAIELPANLSIGVKQALHKSISESFLAGFRIIMYITSGLALASALIAWLTIEGMVFRPKFVPRNAGITRLGRI